MLKQEFGYNLNCKFQHLVLRVAVSTCRNKRKRNGFTAVLNCKFERLGIAGFEDNALARKTAVPHGTRGVNYVLGIKVIAVCDFCRAESEGSELFAFNIKQRTCGIMYGKVNTAVAHHFLVGGVYNGINLHFRYVLSDNFKRHILTPFNYTINYYTINVKLCKHEKSRPNGRGTS